MYPCVVDNTKYERALQQSLSEITQKGLEVRDKVMRIINGRKRITVLLARLLACLGELYLV